ncbi:MAG: transposase [Nanoarchaeota archaeon]|nr:transposase [Nanoarchaeota archaeon]
MFNEDPDHFYRNYNQRQLVESTFGSIKRCWGGTIRSRNFSGQKNEVLLKIICHNLCIINLYLTKKDDKKDDKKSLD